VENKDVNKLKNELENTIERELKKRIKELGLVSSGTLINSIKVSCILKDFKIALTVDAVDYWEFVDEKNGITDYVYNLPVVEDAISELIFAWQFFSL